MARSPQNQRTASDRGLLARPLDALAFLLPLIIFYEVVSLTRPHDRVIAFEALRWFIELFGHVGMLAPGLGVVAILIATHMVSGAPWSIRWKRVALMYAESAILALPLVFLLRYFVLTGTADSAPGRSNLLDAVATGIGAGIYEELVFRLIIMSVIIMIGVDLLRLPATSMAIVGVVLSSLAFAAHHHAPIGGEPFQASTFLFRTVAGVYLAAVFWYRGYGPAAGCHAAYNVTIAFLDT